MNRAEASKLASQVVKQAARSVVVKQGTTNGQPCLHIIDRHGPDASRSGTTIYSLAEWLAHPANRANVKKERPVDTDHYIDGTVTATPAAKTAEDADESGE